MSTTANGTALTVAGVHYVRVGDGWRCTGGARDFAMGPRTNAMLDRIAADAERLAATEPDAARWRALAGSENGKEALHNCECFESPTQCIGASLTGDDGRHFHGCLNCHRVMFNDMGGNPLAARMRMVVTDVTTQGQVPV